MESPSSLNHSNEHLFSFKTFSYDEILSMISESQAFETDQQQKLLLGKILKHSKQNLQHEISRLQDTNHSISISLTGTLTSYFEQSENTSLFCLRLHNSVTLTRSTYSHLHHLLDEFPSDCSALSQFDCDSAYDLLRRFDEVENPFSIQYIEEIRPRFTEIADGTHVLQRSRNNSSSISRSNNCLSFRGCGWIRLLDSSKKRVDELDVVVDAVARGNFVMRKELDTICSLVFRLHTAVDGDKLLVHLVLEKRSGNGMYPIQQVVAQLKRKQQMFIHQLKELEVHICLFFDNVNNIRSYILRPLASIC